MEDASYVPRVRCSGKKEDGTPCDFTSPEKFRFCPKCGSESEQITNPAEELTVIRCPGRKKPCGSALSSDSQDNFCMKCGWKIDKTLFLKNTVKKCPGTNEDGTPCNADDKDGADFCSHCGYEVSSENEGNVSVPEKLDSNGKTIEVDDDDHVKTVKADDVSHLKIPKTNGSDFSKGTILSDSNDNEDSPQEPGSVKSKGPAETERSDPSEGKKSDDLQGQERKDRSEKKENKDEATGQCSGSSGKTDVGNDIESEKKENKDEATGQCSGSSEKTDVGNDIESEKKENKDEATGQCSGNTEKTDDKEDVTSRESQEVEDTSVSDGQDTNKNVSRNKEPDKKLKGLESDSVTNTQKNNEESADCDSDQKKSKEQEVRSEEMTQVDNDKNVVEGQNSGKENDPASQKDMEKRPPETVNEDTEDSDESTDEEESDQQVGDRGSSVDPKSVSTVDSSTQNAEAPKSSKDAKADQTKNPGRDGAKTLLDMAGGSQEQKQNDNRLGENSSKKKKTKKKRGHKQKEAPQKDEQKNVNSWSNEDMVDVVFHALISEAFCLNPNTDKVFLSFRDEHLGGWNGYEKWPMTLKRKDDKLVWYSCSVSMSRKLRNQGFQYQYVVWKKDTGKGQTIRETVYIGKHRTSEDRYFYFQERRKMQKTPWEQYDGFVYPKLSETTFERFVKLVYDQLQKRLSFDISVATKFFLPTKTEVVSTLRQEVTDEYATALSVTDRVNSVVEQMSQKKKKGSEFKKEILTDYVVPLLHHIENLEQKPEKTSRDNDQDTEGFLLAVFILVLFRKNNIEYSGIPFNKHHFRNMHLYPDRKNLKCSTLEALEIHFPSMKEKIADMLLEVIRSCSKVYYNDRGECFVDSSWLYLIPHLHFLRGDSSPYVKHFVGGHTSSEWWGHAHLTDKVEKMKNYWWTISPAEIVQDLEYLFESDHLLPRTIMACISFQNLKLTTNLQKVPAAVCCATLYYYCGFLYRMSHDDKMYLVDCLNDVSKKFKMERKERPNQHHCSSSTLEECFKTREQGMKIAADVLMACQRSFYGLIQLIYAATELFASSVYECPSHEEELINSDQERLRKQIHQDLRTSVEECMKSVNQWMTTEFTTGKQYSTVLQFWNYMMDVDFGIESLSEEWRTLTLEVVQSALSQMTPEDCLKLFEYCDVIGLNKDLQGAMSKAAFKSFEKHMHEGKEVVPQRVSKFASFMSSMVEIYLSRDESEIFEHVLTWKPLVQFFKYLDDKLKQSLTPAATRLLDTARTIIHTVREMLNKGDNPVKLLKVVLGNRDHYLELVKYALGCEEIQVRVMQCVLQARDMELKAYKRDLSYASKLLRMVTHMKKVDCSQLENKIHQMEETFEEELHINICKPLPPEKANEENLKSYVPSTCIAGLSKETLEYAPKLERLGKSKIFIEMWRKEALKVHEDTGFEVAFTSVYQETTKTWRTFCRKVKEGTVSFGSMYERLQVCDKDLHRIEKEFLLINGDSNEDWVRERMNQLQQYELLQSCQKAAQIILEVKTMYEFTGDFSAIEAIQKLGNNENQPMKDLDMSVTETCRILESWKDDKKQECINAYKESRRLVKWLRVSMSDMKEVKVFVDLAFISAGEEPAEIQKVSCFHSAVTGYAPLIFDTPKECDCTQFLENCNQVLQALQSDPSLHLNLRTASQHLHWLKDVKESHGSVEVTSLTQADNINMRGCYKIGNLQDIDVSELDELDRRVRHCDPQPQT